MEEFKKPSTADLRPAFDPYYQKFYRRRCREVVHLTYKRLEVTDQEKVRKIQKVAQPIQKLVDIFLDIADPELLHPNMHELGNEGSQPAQAAEKAYAKKRCFEFR